MITPQQREVVRNTLKWYIASDASFLAPKIAEELRTLGQTVHRFDEAPLRTRKTGREFKELIESSVVRARVEAEQHALISSDVLLLIPSGNDCGSQEIALGMAAGLGHTTIVYIAPGHPVHVELLWGVADYIATDYEDLKTLIDVITIRTVEEDLEPAHALPDRPSRFYPPQHAQTPRARDAILCDLDGIVGSNVDGPHGWPLVAHGLRLILELALDVRDLVGESCWHLSEIAGARKP